MHGRGIKMDDIAAYLGFVYCERQKRITDQKTDNKTNIKGVNNNIFNEILEEFFGNTGGAGKDKHIRHNNTNNFGFDINIFD